MGRELRPRRKPGRKAKPLDPTPITVEIERLGARGDGVGTWQGKKVYVFDALPGERLSLRPLAKEGEGIRAKRLTLEAPSPDRVEAPCPLFGDCGGCDLQQLSPVAYRSWKRALLVTALVRRGFADAESLVRPLLEIEAGGRRRATWSLRRDASAVRLGFRGRSSHRIVDQDRCLQLLPALQALAPALRSLFAELAKPGQEGQAQASVTDSGIDLLLSLPFEPDLKQREQLAGFAETQDLARLSLGELDLLSQRRKPTVTFAGILMAPPPGAFLQPSAEGEAALQAAVLEALPKEPGLLADFYAGCGTFTLPMLKRGHKVLAAEGHAPALQALESAARRTTLATALTCEVRDLERQPISAERLAELDALVFDPPRSGAASLCQNLAEGGPPLLVAVSCNPQTFARDAQTLASGGYRLHQALPIDQFPWSHHLELVAVFRRT